MYFTLFYCLFCGCIIYPPTEFVSAGVTIPCIFSKFLGNENTDFIQYHIRRTAITLLVHSLMPLGKKNIFYFFSINIYFYLKQIIFCRVLIRTALFCKCQYNSAAETWSHFLDTFFPLFTGFPDFGSNKNSQMVQRQMGQSSISEGY